MLAWCGTAGRFASLALCKHGHGSVPNGPHQGLHQESRVGEAQKSHKSHFQLYKQSLKYKWFHKSWLTLKKHFLFQLPFLLTVAIFAGGDAREEIWHICQNHPKGMEEIHRQEEIWTDAGGRWVKPSEIPTAHTSSILRGPYQSEILIWSATPGSNSMCHTNSAPPFETQFPLISIEFAVSMLLSHTAYTMYTQHTQILGTIINF